MEADDVEHLLRSGQTREAAALVIERFGDDLLAYLHRVSHDPGLADDAFSDACLGIWRGIDRFEGRSSPRTWALAIARRSLFKRLRDSGRRRESAAPPQAFDRLVQSVRTRSSTLANTARRSAAEDLRAKLAPQERELIVLRVDRELGWAEIAEILEEPGPARAASARLRKRFERALLKLRRLAEQSGWSTETP